jgi:hypothetical protein
VSPEEKKIRVAYGKFITSVASRDTKRETVIEELKQSTLTGPALEVGTWPVCCCSCFVTLQAVVDLIYARLPEVKAALVASLSQISRVSLQDFDWKVHKVLSSEKISDAKHGVALLQLSLKNEEAPGGVERMQVQFALRFSMAYFSDSDTSCSALAARVEQGRA